MEYTILDNLLRCNDEELISVLPCIRDEEGQRVNLIELKHFLRAERKKKEGGSYEQQTSGESRKA